MIDIVGVLQEISVLALPVIFAITLHEAAHGFVAHRLGDDTAWQQGRVTFNPISHIDLFGTILLPLMMLLASSAAGAGPMLFGYAKPVPVNFSRLHHPRRDMVLVAFAGPGTNILLALVSALLFYVLPFAPKFMLLWLFKSLLFSVQMNVFLAVLNMLPIPPLDGGRVAVGVLPRPLGMRLARVEPYGMLILLAIIFLPSVLGPQLGGRVDVLGMLLDRPMAWIMSGLQWVMPIYHG
jgi:Zn-dependent protease